MPAHELGAQVGFAAREVNESEEERRRGTHLETVEQIRTVAYREIAGNTVGKAEADALATHPVGRRVVGDVRRRGARGVVRERNEVCPARGAIERIVRALISAIVSEATAPDACDVPELLLRRVVASGREFRIAEFGLRIPTIPIPPSCNGVAGVACAASAPGEARSPASAAMNSSRSLASSTPGGSSAVGSGPVVEHPMARGVALVDLEGDRVTRRRRAREQRQPFDGHAVEHRELAARQLDDIGEAQPGRGSAADTPSPTRCSTAP